MIKSNFNVAFIVIMGVGLLFYVLRCSELDPPADVNNLRSEDIASIKIYDRGIFGNDSVIIGNSEKLRMLSNLIISSHKVEFDSINTKANQGLCEIELGMRNNEHLTLVIIKTSFSGGVLSSDDYYYRNDSLLNVITRSLKEHE
jgi:hypothetical protein